MRLRGFRVGGCGRNDWRCSGSGGGRWPGNVEVEAGHVQRETATSTGERAVAVGNVAMPRDLDGSAITGTGNGKGMASLAVWARWARSHNQVPSQGRAE